jgi:hypothetical protein
MIPHIGQALRQKDMKYISWAIKNQERILNDRSHRYLHRRRR